VAEREEEVEAEEHIRRLAMIWASRSKSKKGEGE